MPELIVPIGQPFGMDDAGSRFTVRTGATFEQLDEYELTAWGALAGTLDDPPGWLGSEPATQRIAAVHDGIAAAVGAAPDADYLDLLCERRLAVRIAADDLSAQQFLADHRFVANLVGLWRSPADPDRRFVGFDDDAILSLPSGVHEVYAESAAHPNVLDACASVALRTASSPDEAVETVASLRADFMGTARVIVAIGGGFFDRALG